MDDKPIVFRSRWLVAAPPGEVFDVLADIDSLPRWLPCVCKSVRRTDGEGSASIVFRGFLPFTMSLDVKVDPRPQDGTIRVDSHGELRGQGLWKIVGHSSGAAVSFACEICPDAARLRIAAKALWPIVVLNHRWVMWRVRKRLWPEICRRVDSGQHTIKTARVQ